jgi:hypothetical protein
MSVLQGAAESGSVPVSRLHERQSYDPAPVLSQHQSDGAGRR